MGTRIEQRGDTVEQLLHHCVRGLGGIIRILERHTEEGLRGNDTFVNDLQNAAERILNVVLLQKGRGKSQLTAHASYQL